MKVCFKFHGKWAMRLAVRMKQSRRLLVHKKTQELQSQSTMALNASACGHNTIFLYFTFALIEP